MPDLYHVSERTIIVGAELTMGAANAQTDVDISAINSAGCRVMVVTIRASTGVRIQPFKLGASTPSLANVNVTSGAGTANYVYETGVGTTCLTFEIEGPPGTTLWKGFSIKSQSANLIIAYAAW